MKNIYASLIALLISLNSFAVIGPITGPSSLCVGATVSLSDTTAGGTWTSSNPSIAIAGSSGIIYGITAGTATITYTAGTAYAIQAVTVNATPAPITGTGAVCTGDTTTLTSSTTGGVWTSSSPGVASIGSGSGIVSGVVAGIAVMTYSIATGCNTTLTVTVNISPSSISGLASVCVGLIDTLFDVVPGGTWFTTGPSTATVGPTTGVVTGISPGVTTVAYVTPGGCLVSTTVTVNPLPSIIVGPFTACIGDTLTLSDGTPGGTWSSVSPTVASVNPLTGIVTTLSSGTSVILYALPTGCETLTAVSVDPMPGPITGPAFVCAGNMITLADTLNGGKWTSLDTSLGTIDTVTGVLTGIAPGVLTISYSLGAACTLAGTTNITVTPATCSGTPSGGAATPTAAVSCSGEPDTVNLAGATFGCGIEYQWQSSPDGTTYTNISGATTTSYQFTVSATTTYRCRVYCSSSGLSAYSTTTMVTVHNTILLHNEINIPDTFCSTPDFYVRACGTSSTSNVTIWFGDGSYTNQYLTTTDTSYANIIHSYATPGTYTVKEVLYLGSAPQDSVTFTYVYSFCRTLPVKFYFDANRNGISDTGDHAILLPIQTEIDSSGIPIDTITATGGFYFIARGPLGTVYTYRVLEVPTGLAVSAPMSGVLTDTIAPMGTTLPAKYFGLSCDTGTTHDVVIHVSSTTGRHTVMGTIIVSNTACPGEAVTVTYRHDPRLHLLSAVPSPSSTSGGVITWNLPAVSSSLPSYPAMSFTMESISPGHWFVPGEIVTSVYAATVASGDIDTGNNLIIKYDTASGSFDPNDIAVSPQGLIIPCQQLQYTIRFENTGNDTAHNIAIIDTLSGNLDPHTLQVAIASSQMILAILKDGPYTIAKFDLPGINLLDSSHHNQCDGMVVFDIKTKPGLADGTEIHNRAGIIFDDNPSVLTNTIGNIIGMSAITGNNVVCFPRPDTLNNNSAGGVWSCSNARATVAGGILTGVSAGADTVLYTISNSCGARVATKAISIYPLVIPAVTISNMTADTVCRGTNVMLQGMPVNGGTAPAYSWRVNGAPTGSGDTFSYVPDNGDRVQVLMTSNKVCAASDTASTTTYMHVEMPLTPAVSLGHSPAGVVLPGQPVTFTATVTGAGLAPRYQWMVNWTYIAGATNATYTGSDFANNDSVSCFVTTGNVCGNVVAANSARVAVNRTGTPMGGNGSLTVQLLPNPNDGMFVLSGRIGVTNEQVSVVITDMVGKEVLRKDFRLREGWLEERLSLGSDQADGMYMVVVQGEAGRTVLRIVVKR